MNCVYTQKKWAKTGNKLRIWAKKLTCDQGKVSVISQILFNT